MGKKLSMHLFVFLYSFISKIRCERLLSQDLRGTTRFSGNFTELQTISIQTFQV